MSRAAIRHRLFTGLDMPQPVRGIYKGGHNLQGLKDNEGDFVLHNLVSPPTNHFGNSSKTRVSRHLHRYLNQSDVRKKHTCKHIG